MANRKNVPTTNPQINDDSTQEGEQFRKKAYSAIDQAESKAKQAIEDMEWQAKDKVNRLTGIYHTLSDKVLYLGDRVKGLGRQVEGASHYQKTQLESYIRAHPITSVTIAFGLGALACGLLNGQRRRRE